MLYGRLLEEIFETFTKITNMATKRNFEVMSYNNLEGKKSIFLGIYHKGR